MLSLTAGTSINSAQDTHLWHGHTIAAVYPAGRLWQASMFTVSAGPETLAIFTTGECGVASLLVAVTRGINQSGHFVVHSQPLLDTEQAAGPDKLTGTPFEFGSDAKAYHFPTIFFGVAALAGVVPLATDGVMPSPRVHFH